MGSVSRTAQFAKLHKVLKKHYKPMVPDPQRPVLEHLLFACCLEDARYEAAEEAFAALVHTFFDWNEVRVTSIAELAEVLAALPDARAAANRVKRVLHDVFEATYSFDLEDRRKKNLGPTVKWMENVDGTTSFSIAYTVQAALGGHSIPIDGGTMQVMRLLDLVSEKDAAAGTVPGLERAVAKSKGIEFGSMLHELGADFTANPYSSAVREILVQVDPAVAERLPKRRVDRAAKKPSDDAEPVPRTPSAEEAPQAAAAKEKPSRRKADAGATAPAAPEQPAAASGKKKAGEKRKPAASPSDGAGPAGSELKKKSASAAIAKRKPR